MQPKVFIFMYVENWQCLKTFWKCNNYFFSICVQINWMLVVIFIRMYLKDFKYFIQNGILKIQINVWWQYICSSNIFQVWYTTNEFLGLQNTSIFGKTAPLLSFLLLKITMKPSKLVHKLFLVEIFPKSLLF